MNKRKPVPQEKVRPRELSEELKKEVMARRKKAELDGYRAARRIEHVAGHAKPRHVQPTKAEKRLLGRQLDYEHAGLSARAPGAYHRPGSLQR